MPLFEWLRKKKPPTVEQIKKVRNYKVLTACRNLFPKVLINHDDGTFNVYPGDYQRIAIILVENAVERNIVNEIVQEYRDMMQRAKITADVKNRKAQAIKNRMTAE